MRSMVRIGRMRRRTMRDSTVVRVDVNIVGACRIVFVAG